MLGKILVERTNQITFEKTYNQNKKEIDTSISTLKSKQTSFESTYVKKTDFNPVKSSVDSLETKRLIL